MKKILSFIITIGTVVLVISCRSEVWRWPLMAYQKQTIPYREGQIVCFTDANGDTSLFVTQKIITGWHEDFVYKVSTQYRQVNIQSNDGEIISLRVETMDDGVLTVVIKDVCFTLPFDCDGKFYATDPSRHFYDSLSIDDMVYSDVIRQSVHDEIQLYYNKTYGILQVLQDGENILILNHGDSEHEK